MNRAEREMHKKKHIELVLLYFKYKKISNIGFQSYKIFKNMIIYITAISTKTYIRNIFEIMLSRGLFEVKFIRKSRYYIFNPYKLKINNIGSNLNNSNKFFMKF